MHIPTPKCPACASEQSAENPFFTFSLAPLNGQRQVKTFRFACAPCIENMPGGRKASSALPTKHYNVTGSNPSGE